MAVDGVLGSFPIGLGSLPNEQIKGPTLEAIALGLIVRVGFQQHINAVVPIPFSEIEEPPNGAARRTARKPSNAATRT